VCGLGRFGVRLVELLRERGCSVTVITNAATREDRKQRARDLGAQLIEGDFRLPHVLAEARIRAARALLLVSGDSHANLETALEVRPLAPNTRIVMRLDSDKLADRLRVDFDIDAVLSPPVLAAGGFADAALNAPALPGVGSESVDGGTTPRRRGRAIANNVGLPRRLAHTASSRRRSRVQQREAHLMLLLLVLLFVAGVAVFRHALDLPVVDAIYFTSTILSTVGFGDINLQGQPPVIKLFGSLLMFGGITLIAVLSSFLTLFFVSGNAARMQAERTIRRLRNHVILCGLGSVGFEVAENLLARGVRVVVVDETPGDVHFQNLSERLPLLIGDATRPDLLVRAGIDRARALIAAASEDAVNLEIGLTAQAVAEERRPDNPIRLVLRCFDPDLARRIHAVSSAYILLSSAEVAAPIFVEQALQPRKSPANETATG
jgi:voltage-gated potassium channel Kch